MFLVVQEHPGCPDSNQFLASCGRPPMRRRIRSSGIYNEPYFDPFAMYLAQFTILTGCRDADVRHAQLGVATPPALENRFKSYPVRHIWPVIQSYVPVPTGSPAPSSSLRKHRCFFHLITFLLIFLITFIGYYSMLIRF